MCMTHTCINSIFPVFSRSHNWAEMISKQHKETEQERGSYISTRISLHKKKITQICPMNYISGPGPGPGQRFPPGG